MIFCGYEPQTQVLLSLLRDLSLNFYDRLNGHSSLAASNRKALPYSVNCSVLLCRHRSGPRLTGIVDHTTCSTSSCLTTGDSCSLSIAIESPQTLIENLSPDIQPPVCENSIYTSHGSLKQNGNSRSRSLWDILNEIQIYIPKKR